MYHLRLISRFFQVSLQQDAAFRANFFINVLNTVLTLAAGLAGVTILFGQVETFHGWTFAQVLALVGVYQVLLAVRSLSFGSSLDTLSGYDGEIWDGRFDFTLLRPVDTQFLISVRRWNVWSLVDLALGLVIVGVAVTRLGRVLAPGDVLAFLFSMVVAVTIVYALSLLLTSVVFWFLGMPLIWILDSVTQLGRYPVGIYPGWLRLILTWIIPVGFMTTVPIQALTGTAPLGTLLGGAALAAGLFVIATLFFRISLRRYCGASG